MNGVVLDAWALMAIVRREQPAMGRVYSVLKDAESARVTVSMSIVNVGEVYYQVARAFGEVAADQLLAYMRQLAMTILPATDARVVAAARIKAAHRLSYADAFAVAAALELDATLWTGDPELVALGDACRVEVLRRT
ncbi:MAG: PIN domain-containing protein [Anaerolineae bacterium]